MPSSQMLQTLLPAGERCEVPAAGARTLDVVIVETVLGPVGEAGQMVRAVFGFVGDVGGEGGSGGEGEVARGALRGGTWFRGW